MQRKGFFARMADLWRGFWGVHLSSAEAKNAEAVYYQAIEERRRHYDQLRDATSRLVYLRNRLTQQLTQQRSDLSVVDKALERAALADEDQKALALMKRRRELEDAITRGEADLTRLATQADTAKENLKKLLQSIEELKHERGVMLARKANAEAQRHAQLAFESAMAVGASDGTLAALENVRESIERLESDAGLSESADGDISMSQLRREAELDTDRQALATMKAQLKGRMLPGHVEVAASPGQRAREEVRS